MQSIRAFLLGMAEFRLSFTTHIADWHLANCYDKGRDLAHKLTFRNFDN
jgi:hypothetical protein